MCSFVYLSLICLVICRIRYLVLYLLLFGGVGFIRLCVGGIYIYVSLGLLVKYMFGGI